MDLITRFLSLLLTPWAIFVSSSLSLYLLNQEDLNYNTSVLLPFAGAAAVGVLIGYGILQDSEKNQHFPAAPWLFYFAGPAFMVWNTIDGHLEGALGRVGWSLIVFLAWAALGLILRPRLTRLVAPFFAMFAVLIIASDIYAFASNAQTAKSIAQKRAQSQPRIEEEKLGKPATALPNVYHIVLDGYQSDIFEQTLNDATRESLGGFRFFPANMGLHANTAISIPSVFAGRPWRGDTSLHEFSDEAYSSPESLVQQLKQAGYRTTAYLHQEVAFGAGAFDEVFYHHQFANEKPWSERAFLWTWLYAYWPEPAVRYLLGDGVIERIEAGDLSPSGYAIGSLDTFEGFLANETALPANGRYTFVHLILPHPPYTLSADCEPRESVGEFAQYRCANRVMARLVAMLKSQHKFESSLILFHADHGDDLVVHGLMVRQLAHEPKDIDYLQVRARVLLLFKPPGESDDLPLDIDETPTTLIDVAPSILASVGAALPKSFEGFPVGQIENRPADREFFVHDGVFLYRYSITDGAWNKEPSSVTRTPLDD